MYGGYMHINGTYKATTAKIEVKAKELGLVIWQSRSKWLYFVLIPAIPLSYYAMHRFFLGVPEQGLWLSNLTANFFMLICAWLWFNQDISTAIYKKVRKSYDKKTAPIWFQGLSLIIIMAGLIFYLSLWGYETIW